MSDSELHPPSVSVPHRWGVPGLCTNRGPWDWVRISAAMAVFAYAGMTGMTWLYLSIAQPLRSETLDLLPTYDTAATDADVALLRRHLPAEGVIGYLSRKPELERWHVRLRLAPLLLDYKWREHTFVLVQLPYQLSPGRYELVDNLHGARSFAKDLRVYRKK
jgi:hypothetical protein